MNDELGNLKSALEQAIDILEPNGRIAVISFHSGEDKIVKTFFKEKSKQGLIKLLFKKPIRARAGEVKINPRSRSARLRAAMKI